MPRKTKMGTCTYCGKHAHLTLDHVIPQCLFLPPIPSNIPKVWACTECNNVRKSSDDNYLRDLLVADFDTQHHPVARQLFAKFERSIRRRQSQFARDAAATPGRDVEMYTPGGIYVGPGYGVDLPDGRVVPMLTRMVRGLYRVYFNDPLTQDAHFDVQRLRDLRAVMPVVQGMMQNGVAAYVPVGDSNVFNCIHAHAHDRDRPGASLWFLSFYSSVVFSAAVNLQPVRTGAHKDSVVRA